MARGRYRRRRMPRFTIAAGLAATFGVGLNAALADEGGVGFWLPGTYGSLSALPTAPGWELGTFYYHTSVSANGAVSRAREFEIGRLSPTLSVNLSAKLHADADFIWLIPTYVFETPVLGGQASVGMGTLVGNTSASLSGTLTASIPPFGFVRSDSISGQVFGNGDLYPQATIKWNHGANNFMVYGTGDIPVGQYSSTRLANLGIGPGAVDAGGGYTYLD